MVSYGRWYVSAGCSTGSALTGFLLPGTTSPDALTKPAKLLRESFALQYADKTLTCRDCGRTFTFTAGEQEFYATRGFTNEPGRCPECRSAHKAARGAGGYSGGGTYTSGGYSSGGYSGGGYSGGGYSSDGGGGGYGRGERQMFTVTCSSCGGDARVPFQPRGDKPVYCSDCFSKQKGSGSSSRSYR
jgi:CxxC-x17-CxxC domain-containing protein